MRDNLNQTDRRLAKLLSGHAQEGVNQIAEKLGVTAPTVRSRLRSLSAKNVLKIVGMLNLAETPELISAIVGINAESRGQLNELARQIAALPFVTSVSIVTGRFDLIADVVVEGDVHDLYRFTSELLPAVAGPGIISRSETFVVMKSHNKWIGLPRGCWEEAGNDAGALVTAGQDGRQD